MNKKVLAILVAVLLAAVGVVLVLFYAKSADRRALDGAQLVDVMQVTKTIDAGTSADDMGDSVKLAHLPRTAVVKGAVKSLDEVKGLSSTVVLQPGEQLISSRFARDGVVVGTREATLPKGYQEVTIPLSEARVVGGIIKPGDRVGVYGSDEKNGDGYTTVIEHQVLVLRIRAVGAAAGQTGPATSSGDKEGADYFVTLAVKTQGAIFDIGYYEFGKVYLTKQNDNTERGAWPELAKVPFSKLRDFVELATKE